MRVLLVPALLFAVSASADSERQVAMRLVGKTGAYDMVNKAIRDVRHRHLAEGDEDMDMTMDLENMTPVQIGELFCGVLKMLEKQMAEEGLKCACTSDDTAMNFDCEDNDKFKEVCDKDGTCMDGMSFDVKLGLAAGVDSIMDTCVDISTAPKEIPQLEGKEVCIGLTVELDLAAVIVVEAAEEGDEEDMGGELKECRASIDDEDCKCDVCNEGKGIELDCPHGIKAACGDWEEDALAGADGGEEESSLPFTPTMASFTASDATDDKDKSPASTVLASVPLTVSGLVMALGMTLA